MDKGFWGVIIGSILTTATTILVTWMQNKQKVNALKITSDLEKYKLTREDDLKKLNFFLKPALSIYIENEVYIDVGVEMYDVEFRSKGLSREYTLQLYSLVESNMKHVDLEILHHYFKIKKEYDYEYSFLKYEENHPSKRIENNLFDSSYDLYTKIKTRAKDLEGKYNS